jgi:hypothetical protein
VLLNSILASLAIATSCFRRARRAETIDDGDQGRWRNWYFLTADNGFVGVFEADMLAVVKSLSDETLGSAYCPVETSEQLSFLLQAKA